MLPDLKDIQKAFREHSVVKAKDQFGNWFIINRCYPTCHNKYYVDSLFGGKFLTSEITIQEKF